MRASFGQVKDAEPASNRLQSAEEVCFFVVCSKCHPSVLHQLFTDARLKQVLFFMEVADPPKQQLRKATAQFGGIPGGRGSGRGMPMGGSSDAANLAASLMQRMQQAQSGGGAASSTNTAAQARAAQVKTWIQRLLAYCVRTDMRCVRSPCIMFSGYLSIILK